MTRLQSLVLRYPIRYPLMRLTLFLMCSLLECPCRRPRCQSASLNLLNLQALSFLSLVKFFPNIRARINCQRPAPFLSLTSGNWKEPGWGGKKKARSWNSTIVKVKANDTNPIHAAQCLIKFTTSGSLFIMRERKQLKRIETIDQKAHAVEMKNETDGWWKWYWWWNSNTWWGREIFLYTWMAANQNWYGSNWEVKL